jgi:hypothetical protein
LLVEKERLEIGSRAVKIEEVDLVGFFCEKSDFIA